MSRAGTIQNIQRVDAGSVCITYTTAEEAKMAVQLQQTIISGNSRYIDVMVMDPNEFLGQHNIGAPLASPPQITTTPAQDAQNLAAQETRAQLDKYINESKKQLLEAEAQLQALRKE